MKNPTGMQTQSRRILGIPDEFWIGFVIMIGLFLKLVYDVTTGINISTHDMGAWKEMVNGMPNAGHLGVIQYYYTFHHMPTFDVTTLSCYSNPPFFYVICALILQIFHDGFGWAIGTTLHFLQCVNSIYVMVGLFAGFGIVSKFGVKGRKFIASILFLTFFPAFYNIGATLNNDALCYMCMMLCMNCALGWYQTRKRKTIIATAVWLGLGMMTKLNAVIIAPAIAALFLCAIFYDKRTKMEELRTQFIWFFSVCIPLGMFWPIRNLIRFGTPLFYVQSISDEWQQLAGKYTLLDRLGLPSMQSLLHLHLTTDASLECNVWSQTFKSAIVDEQAINLTYTGTYVLTVALLFMTIILCILMHVMMIRSLIGKRMQFEHKIFLCVAYACVLVSYLRFCFSYPVVCTMNFRYIPVILIFPLVGAGLCGYGTDQDSTFERVTSSVMNWMILAVSFLSAFLFGFYAV
jgi:4-amino-4-deoxy-L-arabinose transferase-like glycosyltransferase